MDHCGKKILFHRHTPWQSQVRCSTNIYAKLFLENGFDVAYMQGLVHPGHLIKRRGQWHSWAQGARRNRRAWVFTPLSVVPYARCWPFNTPLAAHLAYYSCTPSIGTQLARGGMPQPDIIWSANPGSIALRRIFPRARFVFQVVDYYPAYSGTSIKRIEREDYRGADHVFAIGETLKRYIVGEHGIDQAKITVLGQGVFAQDYEKEWPLPLDLEGLKRPIGIWVGVLDKGAPELFRAAARALSERGGSLVLIGPRAAWASELAKDFANVRTLGPRQPDEVPAYLVHADLGLMLYDQSRLDQYKGQNPLKLYEFAAAGLSIISTPHDEFRFIDPPVVTVSNPDEVQPAIFDALLRRDELRRRSLDFAARHDWDGAFQRARREILRLL